ncbi:hypothetical protein PUV54_05735 [Hyphococcus flavus]|uniref:PKD domain-containing protein n=1 Tax=Hyphococcus flavus TaxID=1866326 RepID=A0AAF0CFQ7_9PROT|nr:hypothetical protein [Hyphococcus flavus]WDI32696.1 hypothetical protein PUV54_05735 [Hyphococcus flavus]
MHRSSSLLFTAACLASPAAAQTIANVTAAPSEAEIGEDVTIIVTRSGVVDCSAQIVFGDGSPPQSFTLTDQPEEFTHAYDAAGEYTVTASAGRGVIACQGEAADTVSITSGRSGGSWKDDLQTSEDYQGPTPNRNGSRRTPPLPPPKSLEDTPLYDVLNETRVLLSSDPGVSVLECGTDGNQNACNAFYHYAEDCVGGEEFFSPTQGVAIYGLHKNCGSAGYDTGTDRYQISLKNGWYISKVVEVLINPSSSDDTATVSPIPAGVGVSDAVITADWSASPADEISYWVRIEITGPKDKSPF